MIFEKGQVYDFEVSRMVCYNDESYFVLSYNDMETMPGYLVIRGRKESGSEMLKAVWIAPYKLHRLSPSAPMRSRIWRKCEQ